MDGPENGAVHGPAGGGKRPRPVDGREQRGRVEGGIARVDEIAAKAEKNAWRQRMGDGDGSKGNRERWMRWRNLKYVVRTRGMGGSARREAMPVETKLKQGNAGFSRTLLGTRGYCPKGLLVMGTS